MKRLTIALMALGKWEGRAVAFVIGTFQFHIMGPPCNIYLYNGIMAGCGLGVLLRLLWVLTTVLVRSLRNKPEKESVEYHAVLFEESQPPAYLANADEKKENVVASA